MTRVSQPPLRPVPRTEPTLPVAAPSPALVQPEIREQSAAARSAREAAERLDAYVAEVRARVESQKHYPSMARRRAIEGRVVVRFAIGADGRVSAIETGSGAPQVLSRATRQAVERAAPFRVPPRGAVSVEIPIRYDLDG